MIEGIDGVAPPLGKNRILQQYGLARTCPEGLDAVVFKVGIRNERGELALTGVLRGTDQLQAFIGAMSAAGFAAAIAAGVEHFSGVHVIFTPKNLDTSPVDGAHQ